MYYIKYDGVTVSSPSLADNGYFVFSPTLTQELNRADKLVFTVPEKNPVYSNLTAMQKIVTVYEDGVRLFKGRIIQTAKDFYKQKKVTCEGELAFLNDAVLRPYTFQGTVAAYFTMLVNAYNTAASEDKKIYPGNCTVTDSNNNIVRSNENYVTVWSEVYDKLLKKLGGFLSLRVAVENNVEKTYLDYLAVSGGSGSQVIRFGENLLDLTDYIEGDDLYTRIVPLGAKDDETGLYLTIESETAGHVDYLVNTVAEAIFGRIERVVRWEDVTHADNLKNKAQAELNANFANTQTITISAIDLHLLNVSTDALRLGMYYRVVSVPHGLTTELDNNLFPLSKAQIRLDDPSQSRYTFGRIQPTLTGG